MPGRNAAFDLSEEEESECLDKFEMSSSCELIVIYTIFKYMKIYKKILETRYRNKRQSNKYWKQFCNLPKDLNLRRTAWVKSLDDLTACRQAPFSINPHCLPSNEPAGQKKIDASVKLEPYEARIVDQIHRLSETIDILQKEPSGRFEDRYAYQISLLEDAKKGWQIILENRKTLLNMGGNDFFELFDEGIS